jgi:hypothetical protein
MVEFCIIQNRSLVFHYHSRLESEKTSSHPSAPAFHPEYSPSARQCSDILLYSTSRYLRHFFLIRFIPIIICSSNQISSNLNARFGRSLRVIFSSSSQQLPVAQRARGDYHHNILSAICRGTEHATQLLVVCDLIYSMNIS